MDLPPSPLSVFSWSSSPSRPARSSSTSTYKSDPVPAPLSSPTHPLPQHRTKPPKNDSLEDDILKITCLVYGNSPSSDSTFRTNIINHRDLAGFIRMPARYDLKFPSASLQLICRKHQRSTKTAVRPWNDAGNQLGGRFAFALCLFYEPECRHVWKMHG